MGRPTTLQDALPGLWRVLGRFRPHLRKHRPLIAGSALALLAEIALRLLEPWPLKIVFDRIIPPSRGGGLSGIPVIDALDPMTLLSLTAVALVVIIGLRALATYGNTVGFSLVGNRIATEVRNELYRHLTGLSLSFHTKARSGDLIIRVISDVNTVKEVTVTALLPLLTNLLILLGMVGFMFWLQWQLALLALALVPVFWLSIALLNRRIQEAARRQRHREGAMAATAAESIAAIKIVQALSLEDLFARHFSSRSQRSQTEEARSSQLTARLERSVDILIALTTALVLWYGARLVLHNALTSGGLLVFLAYLRNAYKPLRDFAKYTGRLARATAAGERVLDLLDRIPEVRDLPGALPAPAFRGGVRFEGVSFAYEPGRNVLDRIEFEVHPGQHVALVGPSGIGKSTVISLILRLFDPAQGRVLVDGRDIREFTLASLRSQISVVMQESPLFAASVWDNISYGRPDATREEIEAAARLAMAHEFILALPQGYDTILGERGATLSHGQRQRIAIARAAIRKVPMLILDEPTVGLDEENARAVIEALDRLASGRTTFLITHEMHLAAHADLILYLDSGRVLERGTHAELMRAGGRYADLCRMQIAARDHSFVTQRAHAEAP